MAIVHLAHIVNDESGLGQEFNDDDFISIAGETETDVRNLAVRKLFLFSLYLENSAMCIHVLVLFRQVARLLVYV